MTSKPSEQIWQTFPGSHLHCDVTASGLRTYRIVMSLLDSDGGEIAKIEHYGTGDLAALKNEALVRLVDEISVLKS